jgi:hypothetical protein
VRHIESRQKYDGPDLHMPESISVSTQTHRGGEMALAESPNHSGLDS